MSYKRPHFVREESWRYKRVKESWRSPRGKTSRVRRSKQGWPPVVKIGYARPKAIRGAHPSGLKEIMVWRPKDLEGVDPKTQAVRIAHTVGERKRVDILDQAKKANIRVLNPGPKKEPEVTPEVTTTEPTPTPEPTALPEPTAEAAAGGTTEAVTEETGPQVEPKETETTKEPPKKRKASKKTKEKRAKK
ncbi:MAG TPA: 50S ribosomal protein L32e [Candidatus Dormibacteraeota bacterium]|nr:50S ribosomal protein L32e [Candidatus Dormibacteraeota bacterium]